MRRALIVLLIGYFKTENLYELWDVHKRTVIRARDVIFWEDQLGNSHLRQWALPNSVSILPVANELVTATQDDLVAVPPPREESDRLENKTYPFLRL